MSGIGTRLSALTAAVILLAACVSGPDGRGAEERDGESGGAWFPGSGRSESLLRAMNLAKMDAVRNAVVYLIGAEKEGLHHGTLQRVLYETENPNRYVHTERLETLRKERIEGEFIYEIRVPVDLRAVEQIVETYRLSGDGPSGIAVPAAVSPGGPESAAASAADRANQTGTPPAPGDEERRFVLRYVDRMSYLVTWDDESGSDPDLMRTAVGAAVEYLVANGLETVDPDQVERLRNDQRMVWEAETGKDESIVQWIARKLDADVYIQIAARTRGEQGRDGYAGHASATLKLFEASTGRILASVPDSGLRALSLSSEKDAVRVALQSAVRRSMPAAVEQARAQMEQALERGIRYEVTFQRTMDPRVMSRFRSRLVSRVKDVQTLSQSPEETRYAVFFLGRVEDLEAVIYDVAATVPGLEGILQVYLRGRTITFDSGL